MPPKESQKAINHYPHPDEIIKPGELIDIIEITPLTLHDKRIYNLLIANAWKQITQDIEHSIPKSELRGSHSNNEWVNQSIKRLSRAVAELNIQKNGKPATEIVHLLSDNIQEKEENGYFYYGFTKRMREIIHDSNQFGKLQKEVMFAFSSKYALTLYEVVQKRGNLSYKFHEDFSIDKLRGLLGVPDAKLKRFADINAHVLKPAVMEVTALSDFNVHMEPIKQGREVIKIRLNWWKKSPDELKEAFKELKRPRVGRKARIEGKVEKLEMELTALREELTKSLKSNP